MRYRKLDADGDMQFGHGAGDFWKDQPEAVGQSVKTRLLLFTGEWFLDVTAGTPWGGFPLNDEVVRRGRVLGTHTQLSRDAAIRDRILSTEGVRTILQYGSSFNPNTRFFSINAIIDTIYSIPVAVTVRPGPELIGPPVVRFSVKPTAPDQLRRPPPPLLRGLPRSVAGR